MRHAVPVYFLTTIPAPDRHRVRREWLRFEAILELHRLIDGGAPIERALADVVRAFTFHVSASSVRAWAAKFASCGLPGLLENKVGRVGRKPRRDRRQPIVKKSLRRNNCS
jgi:hypothetical protein